MEKKDIYEHLAKIYLDASSKKKKKRIRDPRVIRNFVLMAVSALLVTSFFTFNLIRNKINSRFEVALYLQNEAVKINFNFDPAKKEVYDIKLNELNLSRFKTLSFMARKTVYTENINLKVEFTTRFHEKSEIYVKNIPCNWQEYKLPLSDFKGIMNWSDMSGLSFTVEEWNAQGKKGVVYIDNLKFIR